MDKEEAIKQCNDLINDFKNSNGLDIRVNATDVQAIETALKELESSISKDKIREKIEELKQAEILPLKDGEIELYYFAEDILKEL